MKARLLKQLLMGDRGYMVADYGDYIAVGSPLCHDLIKVEKEGSGFKMRYALGWPGYGRESVPSDDILLDIWDKLEALIKSGELIEILNGEDVLENPLPVFTIKDNELFESTTDAYGWPNITKEGFLMHDNTYFKTKEEALENGIKSCEYRMGRLLELREETEEKLSKFKESYFTAECTLNKFQLLLKKSL